MPSTTFTSVLVGVSILYVISSLGSHLTNHPTMGKNDFVFCRSVDWKSTFILYFYLLNLFGPATHAGIATPHLVSINHIRRFNEPKYVG